MSLLSYLLLQDQENFAERSQLTKALIEEHGQALIQALLNASLFSLPTYMQPDSAEIIYELMVINRMVSIVQYRQTFRAPCIYLVFMLDPTGMLIHTAVCAWWRFLEST